MSRQLSGKIMCVVLMRVSAFCLLSGSKKSTMYFIDGIECHNINNCNKQLTIIMGTLKTAVG